jgi:hypothetical protein
MIDDHDHAVWGAGRKNDQGFPCRSFCLASLFELFIICMDPFATLLSVCLLFCWYFTNWKKQSIDTPWPSILHTWSCCHYRQV